MQINAEGSVSHDIDCRQVRNQVQIENEDVMAHPRGTSRLNRGWPKFRDTVFAQNASTRILFAKSTDGQYGLVTCTCLSQTGASPRPYSQKGSLRFFKTKTAIKLESRLNRGWPKFRDTVFAQNASTKIVLQKALMDNMDL